MNEESKVSSGGALVARSPASSDDRKSSIGSTATGKKVIIKSADMKEDIQKEAVDIAIAAFEKYNVEKDVAEHIKKMFDKMYGPTWHCIVGKNFVEFGIVDYIDSAVRRCFSSYVTHETNHFVYFYLDSKAVLLFKSG